MGLIRISGSGAGVCSEQSCCEAGAARGSFPSLSLCPMCPLVSGIPGRDGESDSLWEPGRATAGASSRSCHLPQPSSHRGVCPAGSPGDKPQRGDSRSVQQLPLPWATPGAEGTPAGLGGQVPYFHHARNPERFLYLIPLVGVEVVDGSAPPLCSSVSRRPSAEGGFCRCFLCVHLPRNKKSPVSFFLPSPRQGIPAPGILHIHGVIRQHLP